MNEETRKKIRWKPFIISGVVAIVISAIIVGIFWGIKGINLASSIDGFGYATVAILSMGGLAYVARNGFFDIFAYGFRQATTSIFAQHPTEFNDFSSYKEDKRIIRERRAPAYLSFILWGALLLVTTFILSICLG